MLLKKELLGLILTCTSADDRTHWGDDTSPARTYCQPGVESDKEGFWSYELEAFANNSGPSE